MDLQQIKELMVAMEKAGVKKISLKEKTGFELQLEMQDEFPPAVTHSTVHSHPPMFIPHPMAKSHDFSHSQHIPQISQSMEEEKSSKSKTEQTLEGKFITSPMVGTLYASSSPDNPPFVKVGDKVSEQTIVCIVEAMKVMNEVKAGISGTVAEVCIDNGHPVEFGTKLFRIV